MMMYSHFINLSVSINIAAVLISYSINAVGFLHLMIMMIPNLLISSCEILLDMARGEGLMTYKVEPTP